MFNECLYIPVYVVLQQYLNKYGYINCTYARRLQRDVDFAMFEEMDEVDKVRASHKKACKTVDVLAALKKLQLKLGLPPSGVLDGKTKQVLSSGRCGNKDNDHPLLVVSKENTTHSESDDDESRSHHRDKRSLLETIIGGRNKHMLSPSVRRRKRMLAEIMERIANENDTEKYRVHPRRKRSTPMDPFRPGDEAYLTKFKQGDEPITWRLLEAGYSKRFPITDQQSMLELAFRMWSEVVPLRFRRQDGGDIDDVDVQIAFGKGKMRLCYLRCLYSLETSIRLFYIVPYTGNIYSANAVTLLIGPPLPVTLITRLCCT